VLPWEVWKDLMVLTRMTPGHQVLLRSSASPTGSRYDRHAPDDSRFLRVEGDEGVIFDEPGAGAITRIWMTQGEQGVSRDFDPQVRIRIRLDGQSTPVVDMTLRDFFGGMSKLFVPPVVSDRRTSSGGSVCMLPIPYRDGCTVSLVGAAKSTIYFQITHHRLEDAEAVTTFTGKEVPSKWWVMLGGRRRDPWLEGPYPTTSGSVTLPPGAAKPIALLTGPDTINGLILRVPRQAWQEVRLVATFDGETRVEMPLASFFGMLDESTSLASMLVGHYGDDDLYCYFPMPFHQAAVLELQRPNRGGGEVVEAEYAVRTLGVPPTRDSMLFGAVDGQVVSGRPGKDLTFLDLTGPGRWVGLSAEFSSMRACGWEYLEGDEMVWVDGDDEPAWRGTGVEDFFGGGYYFRIDDLTPVPFSLPLYGMLYDRPGPRRTGATAMYRLMLTDALPFTSSLRARFEAGPEDELLVRLRSVAYYYRKGRGSPS
jgi:hypothetical protein